MQFDGFSYIFMECDLRPGMHSELVRASLLRLCCVFPSRQVLLGTTSVFMLPCRKRVLTCPDCMPWGCWHRCSEAKIAGWWRPHQNLAAQVMIRSCHGKLFNTWPCNRACNPPSLLSLLNPASSRHRFKFDSTVQPSPACPDFCSSFLQHRCAGFGAYGNRRPKWWLLDLLDLHKRLK